MRFFSLVAFAANLNSAASSLNSSFCAEISSLYRQNPSTLAIPGELAYNCLQSLAFRTDLGVSFIRELLKYVQFHSTLETLKNPPAGYLSPPTDILGRLHDISERAESNEYQNQYKFDSDITQAIRSANDGHFFVSLCSTSIFSFNIPLSLVSISVDGVQLPQIYTDGDASLLTNEHSSVSPLVSVNGVHTSEFLEELSSSHAFQDPDARYNSLFASLPRKAAAERTATSTLIYNSGLWPGAATYRLEFANGTVNLVETMATLTSASHALNFTNERSLFELACLPTARSPAAPLGQGSPSQPLQQGPSGYPDSLLRHPFNLIAGYYPNGKHLRDVAVLSVFTFETSGTYRGQHLPRNATKTFSQVASGFLEKAAADGKKRILIDLSGNAGGDLTTGFNLFRLFFPDVPIYTATRFRAHEAVNLLGQTFQHLQYSAFSPNPLSYRSAVTPDQRRRFSSWPDFYGPHEILDMNSSSLFASFNMTERSSDSDPISGYGTTPLRPSQRLFAAEDIIMITDGLCASTCALFVEQMRKQGVRSIAFGGRPRHGPMQAVGGVKGGQSAGVRPISRLVTTGYELASRALNTSLPLLTSDQMVAFRKITPIPVEEFPLQMHGGVVNLRNEYREGDNITPLQFVYEAADCRLFYQAGNYLNQETVWSNAAAAVFANGKCVDGSRKGLGAGDGMSDLCSWPWPDLVGS